MLHGADHAILLQRLSPVSSKTAKSLEGQPTKKGLADYEKKLQSYEQCVRKALQQLEKSADSMEAAHEQELAHRERRAWFADVCS